MLGKLQSHLQRENESHTTGPSTMPIASDVIFSNGHVTKLEVSKSKFYPFFDLFTFVPFFSFFHMLSKVLRIQT
jgi:hypothetical protein